MPDESPPALVAVVEDDGPSRSAIGRILQAGGFEPALFASAEAFKAATLGRVPVCLVLDVHLGGMSGIDLQRDLRRSGSALPIIITTAHRADVIRQRAEQHGCLAFLLKPFNADTLLTLLRSIQPAGLT
jgi:FixJ family two-component response regulator